MKVRNTGTRSVSCPYLRVDGGWEMRAGVGGDCQAGGVCRGIVELSKATVLNRRERNRQAEGRSVHREKAP